MTRVAVYGAGGHGHDIAATLPDFAGFVDDDPERHELEPLGAYELLLGMNDPQVRYRKWRMTLNFPWHNDGVWVHPSANLGPSVKLGQHTHVNAGAFLTRCTVGEFCTIAPNATVLGDVTLGDRVMVGANATIRNLVTVCSDVVIGAGAVVIKDITEPGTYVGCPARPAWASRVTDLGPDGDIVLEVPEGTSADRVRSIYEDAKRVWTDRRVVILVGASLRAARAT